MSSRLAQVAALLIVVLTVGLTIRYNHYVLWATDSGAYISQAHAWAAADLFMPGEFVFWAPWDATGNVAAPLGHRAGPIKGTITGFYPLGYPVLLSLALLVGGPLAPHLVSPILLGVLAWCAWLIGRRLSTEWAGVMAALLIAGTPVSLGHVLMPMSDVPAAAFWAIAWVMVLRPGLGAMAAGGSAAALAIMIRPNLAPLGFVLAATAMATDRKNFAHVVKRLAVLGTAASLGPLMVMWSQAVLYGAPLQSGYPASLDYFFQASRVPYNASFYARTLLELHSWLIFAGLAALPIALYRHHRHNNDRQVLAVVLSALGLILVNYALYLPYLSFDGWYWLRFLLPALLALFVLFAAVMDWIRLWLMGRWRWAGPIVALPVLFVLLEPRHQQLIPSMGFGRLQLMGHYLREVLPSRPVVLTFAHGGAISVYTGVPIVRLDLIEPTALDDVISDLQDHGFDPVFVLDLPVEADTFTKRFIGSKYVALDWPARAEFASLHAITYHVVADRDAFLSGDRWPVDVLVAPPSTEGVRRWTDYRAPHERMLLPWPSDTTRFRAQIETVYRDELGRRARPSAIDLGTSTKWLRRYIRFRLHDCGHEEAVSRVFAQIDGAPAPSLCGRPTELLLPTRTEAVSFREQLDRKIEGSAAQATATTHVDGEGEAVWLLEYLRHRLAARSHDDATQAVLREIRCAAGVRCDDSPTGN